MSFFAELKRRNVFRVGVAYIVAAWLIAQAAELAADSFGAPEWFMKMLLTVLGLGLPIALIFAWAFELTPEGIKREREVDRSQSITSKTGRKLDFMIIAVLAVALAYFVADKFFLQSAPEPVTTDTAQQEQAAPRSIAVLPLVNMSADPNNEYFSDGLTEELLNILARIGELQVAGRTSSFAFKGQSEDLRGIAEKLNVESILEGSVRRDANRVRITLQLINAADGYHLWSETYDRELEDIFAVQEDIAREVAAALRVTLLGEDVERIEHQARADLNAYDLYLQGLKQLNEFSYSSLPAAVKSFQQAIAEDPDYLPAQLKLVETWTGMGKTGAIPQSEMQEKAAPIIERVLSQDPGNDLALTLKGRLLRFDRRESKARDALEQALDNNPRNVLALTELGRSYFDWGDTARGMELLREAGRIDPYSPDVLWDLTFTHGLMQQPERAVEFAERIGELEPDNPNRYWGPALAYLIDGQLAQAVVHQIKAFNTDPDDHENAAGVAMLWMDMGDLEQAEQWARIADSLGADQPVPIKLRVLMHQHREQYGMAADLARLALERGLDNRQGSDDLFRRAWAAELYRRGDFETALDWYRERKGGLFESPPQYRLDIPFDADQLIEISILLLGQDPKSEQALDMLGAAETKVNIRAPNHLPWRRMLQHAEIAAARGQHEPALELVLKAYETGMRVEWREKLVNWVAFDAIRDTPEFRDMITALEADMDRQREQAYQMLDMNAGSGP